jgi:parallel beta-helix repeat protein
MNIESSHGVIVTDHVSSNNFCRAFWLDTDVIDVSIDRVVASNNNPDGFFLEAVQGPISITNSEIDSNVRFGILSGMAEYITLENNTIRGNGRAALHISGDDIGRWTPNFETWEYRWVYTMYWTIRSNVITGEGRNLLGLTIDETRWNEFITTLDADLNEWCDPTKPDVFRWAGGAYLEFAEWQSRTGQDANSTYCSPADPTGVEDDVAVAAAFTADVYPSPALGTAQVRLAVERDQHVRVDLYDLLGKRVRSVFASRVGAATPLRLSVLSDGLASGVYLLRIAGDDFAETRPVIFSR